jgi:hypothetical protein
MEARAFLGARLVSLLGFAIVFTGRGKAGLLVCSRDRTRSHRTITRRQSN